MAFTTSIHRRTSERAQDARANGPKRPWLILDGVSNGLSGELKLRIFQEAIK